MTTIVHDELISSFLGIAVGQTVETARTFLHTTNWNIEEALNLFLINNNNNNYHHEVASAPRSTTLEPPPHDDAERWNDSENSDSRLSSMFRPPSDLLFEGSFQDAKYVASERNLWLLVNLQSRTDFASQVLNRDVWSNVTVSEAVKSSFILCLFYDDTIEGKKISSFYRINDSSLPVVLLIDPITGQKMRMWSGGIDPHSLVEDFIKYMDAGPNQHIASIIRKRQQEKEKTCSSSDPIVQVTSPSWDEEFEEKTCSTRNNIDESLELVKEDEDEMEEEETYSECLEFPLLTEEPKGDCDRSVTCCLCFRFPDGSRKQRRFLKSEPIQLLWSFCYSHMKEGSEIKAFKLLVHGVPGASKTLDYGVNATFHQSGLDNSMISVIWE